MIGSRLVIIAATLLVVGVLLLLYVLYRTIRWITGSRDPRRERFRSLEVGRKATATLVGFLLLAMSQGMFFVAKGLRPFITYSGEQEAAIVRYERNTTSTDYNITVKFTPLVRARGSETLAPGVAEIAYLWGDVLKFDAQQMKLGRAYEYLGVRSSYRVERVQALETVVDTTHGGGGVYASRTLSGGKSTLFNVVSRYQKYMPGVSAATFQLDVPARMPVGEFVLYLSDDGLRYEEKVVPIPVDTTQARPRR